jgi:hypothetical protein
MFGQPEKTIIHKTSIIIEPFHTTNTECPICLSELDDDIVITPCNHSFHQSCIWQYLETNHKIIKNTHNYCNHGDIPMPYDCPLCRRYIQH